MKLYLLQGIKISTLFSAKLYQKIFIKKPTVEDLARVLHKREENYNELNCLLEGKEYIDLSDAYSYKLKTVELDNKEILTNMDEEIKVLLLTNCEGSTHIVCAITRDITENKIPKDDLNHIKKDYITHHFINEDEVVEALLSGEERIATNDDDLYEWDIINTKDINKIEG